MGNTMKGINPDADEEVSRSGDRSSPRSLKRNESPRKSSNDEKEANHASGRSSYGISSSSASSTSYFSRSNNNSKFTELQLQVAHFTPCCFPMIPIVTQETMILCRRSWSEILAPVERDDRKISGLTVFYTEFYNILALIDKGGFFERVLRMHTSGINSIAAKGAIIIRMINYSLSIDPDKLDELERALKKIGKSHKGFNIRPWMYQGFIEAILTTLTVVLDERATSEVMSAWCNLLALVMQFMLPHAIEGMVQPYEMDANFSGDMLSLKAHSSKGDTSHFYKRNK